MAAIFFLKVKNNTFLSCTFFGITFYKLDRVFSITKFYEKGVYKCLKINIFVGGHWKINECH